MFKITRRVVARFPDHELAVERLARTSESFRAMCEDYIEGLDALEHWQHAARHDAEVAELRESLTELEEEILERLREEVLRHARRRGTGRG